MGGDVFLVLVICVDFIILFPKNEFVTLVKRQREYLTTRVRGPDTDDWTKLAHMIKYLRGMKLLPLTLSTSSTGILKWWVDGSFAVHPEMRGHTGGGLSFGHGFPIVTSTKQKLNTRSSTESELVGVDDCMPAICWTRYFVQAQGREV